MSGVPRRLTLLYWGRRGALSRLALELARAAATMPNLQATFSVSRQNDLFADFEALGTSLLPVTTFESSFGAVAGVHRLPALRRALADHLAQHQTDTVVALMPHVWSQLLIDTVRDAGARYVTIVHDAVHHPGDRSGRLHRWLRREARLADHVITLSRAVATQLTHQWDLPADRLSTSFLPDICYGEAAPLPLDAPASPAAPLRLLFFGRLLSYKGLPRLIDAVAQLRQGGVPIALSVCGDGDIRLLRARLDAIGAEVVNRWIGEPEVAALFRRCHAVVLSHSEASQSGVAAVALGAGVPVVAVPVGGIVEQIRHEDTGLLAAEATSAALADTLRALATSPALHQRLRDGIARSAPQRSVTRFLSDLSLLVERAEPAGARTA